MKLGPRTIYRGDSVESSITELVSGYGPRSIPPRPIDLFFKELTDPLRRDDQLYGARLAG